MRTIFGGLVESLNFAGQHAPDNVVRTQLKEVRPIFGGVVESLNFAGQRAPDNVVRTQLKVTHDRGRLASNGCFDLPDKNFQVLAYQALVE